MTELAYAMVLVCTTLARDIKPLEHDGYLVQFRDSSDGRSRRLSLTNAGRTKLSELNHLWHVAQHRFEGAYDCWRAATLRVALAEIYSDEFYKAFNLSKGPASR